jgi:6-phosphogluconolactonase
MGAPPAIVVEPDADALAAAVAARLVALLRRSVEDDRVAHLALTGGGILEKVIGALPGVPDPDWRRVHLWWGDERYVPADSGDRNDKAAFEAGLARLDLDSSRIHRMPAADGAFTDPEAGAGAPTAPRAPEADGGDVPEFAAIVLGIGPDGHCASLFPHHPGTRVTDRSVIAVHDSPKPPPTRLSLTFASLDAAREVWFVASGTGKAEAVAKALDRVDPVTVPSSAPRGRDRTVWFVDEDAAGQLPG